MKITEFPAVTELAESDVFIKDGDGGTKKIAASDMILAMLDLLSPKSHRLIFRGKNLGSQITAEQKAAIQNGSFKDLWLGDYWESSGVKWRIVDFDYFLNKGDSRLSQHHVVVMPDTVLYKQVMNSTATTTGGYFGSTMYTGGLENAKTMRDSVFPDAIISFKEYFVNSMTNGRPSGGIWATATIALPTEQMMYGNGVYQTFSEGSIGVNKYTLSYSQLALFQADPTFITCNEKTWLRDTCGTRAFCSIDKSGYCNYSDANDSEFGPRPFCLIG